MPNVTIAYYSGMGRYWLNKYMENGDMHSHVMLIMCLTKLVESINNHV